MSVRWEDGQRSASGSRAWLQYVTGTGRTRIQTGNAEVISVVVVNPTASPVLAKVILGENEQDFVHQTIPIYVGPQDSRNVLLRVQTPAIGVLLAGMGEYAIVCNFEVRG